MRQGPFNSTERGGKANEAELAHVGVVAMITIEQCATRGVRYGAPAPPAVQRTDGIRQGGVL
jgi:hypothetical protein